MKFEFLVLESYQDLVTDEAGVPTLDEGHNPIYVEVWTAGEYEFEGELSEVLNGLGADGWQVVAATGSDAVSTVILKRRLAD